jgi:hypothetical protein
MVLFKFRCFPGGPNLVSAGVYPLRGWETVLVWFRNQRSVAIRLPIVARRGW